MAKFNAGQAVERLEYDFTDFGGGAGTVTEPSTGTVNRFFNNMKGLMKEVRHLRDAAPDLDLDDLDDDQLVEAMSKVDELEGEASAYQRKSMEYLAELCGATREIQENPDDPDGEKIEVLVGGSPSLAELESLPYRVLTAFSQWLVQEIQPKRTTPATKR